MFASEGGDITAWFLATGTTAVVKAHVDGAVFKSLAIWHTRLGNILIPADFASGVIRVFDRHFHEVQLPAGFFRDRRLPRGYAPFNVMTRRRGRLRRLRQAGARFRDEAHGQAWASLTGSPTRHGRRADRHPRLAERAVGYDDRSHAWGQVRG